ncbi:hypothetical protein BH09BAC1_BH09BAC1_12480 [soil metagenome]
MKSFLFRAFLVCIFFSIVIASQAQTLTGIYTLPGTVNGTNITNLTTLKTFLANAANPVSGNVVFEFGPTYTSTGESFPIAFNGFTGTGTVTIRPSAAVTTSLLTTGSVGGNTTPLIDLSSANYFTFDGRPGGTGNNIRWTFQNTSTTGVTFLFRTSTYVTLQYLQIESQNISGTSGTILFTNNNQYNTIQNCNITHYAAGTGRPLNAIYSTSTTATPNTHNSILNNDISNFAPGNISTATGVCITGTGINTNYSNNWTIQGNSFYRSATELGAAGYIVINFIPGLSSTGNVISGNYIGGDAALAAGTLTTQVSGQDAFQGIYVWAGATQVTNNVVQGITLTNTSGTSVSGIYIASGTTANFNVSGNTVANITNAGQWGAAGIVSKTSGTVTINNNTVNAIYSTQASNVVAKSVGIYTSSGAAIITNNTVYDLASATGTGSSSYLGTDAAAAGIVVNSIYSGARQVVSNNTVYKIYSSQTFATAVRLYGISVTGAFGVSSSHILNGNLVYNIYGNASNANTSPTGIKIWSGSYRITNNVINLGFRTDATPITSASSITGIIDSSSGNTNMLIEVLHNTVVIGGTAVTAGNSYAFRRVESNTSPSNTEDLRNNIFVNNRTNSTGTGKHYSLHLDRVANVISVFNMIYSTASASGYMPFHAAGTDYATLAGWQTATTLDAYTVNADPLFILYTPSSFDLHVATSSPANQAGTYVPVDYDKDSILRSSATPIDIGAYVVGCGSGGVTPTVTLAATATTICAGTLVTFTATPSAGASGGNYNFYRNGVSVQNGTNNTYANNALGNNDSVRVVFTASASCVSSTPVSSNTITMTVNPTVTPTVILAISQNNICPGTSVTFTATSNNGGSSPTYSFIRNGVSVQNGAGNAYITSTLSNNDSVRVVLTSNANCSSPLTSTVQHIVVVVKPNAASTVNQTICFGTSYLGHNTTGVHRDTFTAANGCDSIRTLNLTVRPQISSNLSKTICFSASYLGHNTTGIHRDTLTAASGCDSIRILNLTIRPQNATSVTASICPGGNYAGHTTAGTFIDIYPDVNGCDSTRTVTLTISSFTTNTITQTICFGDTLLGYTATGFHRDTFATGGCDSIRILNLTVRPANSSTITRSICQGQSFDGYTSDGTYTDVFTDINGCDSTRTLTLTVSNVIITSESVKICAGDTFRGHTVSGVYRDTLVSSGGCDSIHRLGLTVRSENVGTQNLSICDGDSYLGHTVAGVYVDTLTDEFGCDSIHTLTLALEPSPFAPAIVANNNVLSIEDTFTHYQWYLDGILLVADTTDTLAATVNGNYTVAVANATGCADTSTAFQVTGIGISEIAVAWDLHLFPNPTEDIINLKITGIPNAQWALYNHLGQELLTGTATGNAVINLQQYAEGMYYLKVQAGGEVVTKKVLLVR